MNELGVAGEEFLVTVDGLPHGFDNTLVVLLALAVSEMCGLQGTEIVEEATRGVVQMSYCCLNPSVVCVAGVVRVLAYGQRLTHVCQQLPKQLVHFRLHGLVQFLVCKRFRAERVRQLLV